MTRQHSRNRSSDKSKIHFYKGREPTERELALKDERDQVLLVDEVQQAGTQRMRVVITWVPAGQRQRFRKNMDRIDPGLKKEKEAKYSNTLPSERLDLYESVVQQDFEIYDTYNIEFPPDVVSEMRRRQGHAVDYWKSRYLYQLESVLCTAVDEHRGRIDVVMDKPPFDIVEEIRLMCERIVGDDCDIRWFTISPSRHVVELQVHDFLCGLDYDIRTSRIQRDPHILEMSERDRKRYLSAAETVKARIRNWK